MSGMGEPVTIDHIDAKIIDLLREDGRRTVRDVAERVNLTPGPVNRRIARLEKLGVITGYTVKINYARLSGGIEAVTELGFAGDLDLAKIMELAVSIPEVEEVLTVAGDPDALVRIRVGSVEHLQRVVNRLRTGGSVTRSRTLVVLESWARP
jgi:Lrp/AsnC family transcriptional regulator, leucine-responsive regulatory protein